MTDKQINGVNGTLETNPTGWTWKSERRDCPEKGDTLRAEIRFDDSCKNGHASFAITGTGWHYGREDRGGCLHDEIAEVFPELAPLIKWHLCSTDGPMHYIANTTYLASNRDCWGNWPGRQSAFGISEGKPREFDAARRTAIWPNATEKQLSRDKVRLEAMLRRRLPALLSRFRRDIESAGLEWPGGIEAQQARQQDQMAELQEMADAEGWEA